MAIICHLQYKNELLQVSVNWFLSADDIWNGDSNIEEDKLNWRKGINGGSTEMSRLWALFWADLEIMFVFEQEALKLVPAKL